MQTWVNETLKAELPDGVWQHEPDKAQWIYRDVDCLIVRNNLGALCGYVGVPPTHRYFDIDYDSIRDIDVHGGLTFSDRCHPHPEGEHLGICHIEAGAANKTVWWLGFDCAHAFDLVPGMEKLRVELGLHSFDDTYRDFRWVAEQTMSLADQLITPIKYENKLPWAKNLLQ